MHRGGVGVGETAVLEVDQGVGEALDDAVVGGDERGGALLGRAARKVGTTATPHDLRHYFASMQIRGGQSIKVLQALLGHKSAVQTRDTRSRAVIDAALGIQPRNGASADGEQLAHAPGAAAGDPPRRCRRSRPTCVGR